MYLSKKTIISIDVESNGLYGQPFCVGAVEMDWGGRVTRDFLARCPLDQVEDEWVLNNVIPAIKGIDETHHSLLSMQEDFFSWLCNAMKRNERSGVVVLVDVGFPVDCKFLYDAITYASGKDGTMNSWIREKYSPYPLIDLASVLAGAGFDPDVDREEMASLLMNFKADTTEKHHPVFDAEMSGVCLVLATRRIEELSA